MAAIANKLAVPLASALARGLAAGFGTASLDPVELFALGEAGAWYDPSDLSSVFQDAAATIPAAVGDPVGRINDLSGNALHMTSPAAGTTRPTLRQDAGGFYYLEFDGVDDYMETAASLTLEATWTLAHAGQFAAGSGTSASALLALSTNATNYLLCGFRQDVGGPRGVCRADSTADALASANAPSGGLPAATNRVAMAYLDAAVVAAAGGSDTYTTTALAAAPLGPVASCKLRFGTQAGVALTIARHCYGALAIKRALTDAERTGLHSTLRGKMGA